MDSVGNTVCDKRPEDGNAMLIQNVESSEIQKKKITAPIHATPDLKKPYDNDSENEDSVVATDAIVDNLEGLTRNLIPQLENECSIEDTSNTKTEMTNNITSNKSEVISNKRKYQLMSDIVS